jgi:ABC-2 type transport system permease protein
MEFGLGSARLMQAQIIGDFNREIREEWMILPKFNDLPTNRNHISQVGSIQHFNYRLFMVPGVLAILVTMVGSFLAALNIVAEKEVGTIEQINVSPLKKHEFILGKLIPFWVLGMISITLGMIFSFVIFQIIPFRLLPYHLWIFSSLSVGGFGHWSVG